MSVIDTTLERQYAALLHRCNVLLDKLPADDKHKLQSVLLDLFTHYSFVLQSYKENVQKTQYLRSKVTELERQLRSVK